MSRALLCLTPSESKRLIAKAVAGLPEVKKALTEGLLIIVRGTTTSFVAEEITGRPVDRDAFVAGYIGPKGMMRTPKGSRGPSLVLSKGEPWDVGVEEALDKFRREDVFIKGANMVDLSGMAGGLLGHPWGGTTGKSIGALAARGSRLVVPVGLEKLIPSVAEVAGLYGNLAFDHVHGDPVGLMPLVGAKVVTEIQALEMMFDVEVRHAGGGGVGGAEGSIVLIVEGTPAEVSRAFELASSIKGEPAFGHPPAD